MGDQAQCTLRGNRCKESGEPQARQQTQQERGHIHPSVLKPSFGCQGGPQAGSSPTTALPAGGGGASSRQELALGRSHPDKRQLWGRWRSSTAGTGSARSGREQRTGLCCPSPRQRGTCHPLNTNPKPVPLLPAWTQVPGLPEAQPLPSQPCAHGGQVLTAGAVRETKRLPALSRNRAQIPPPAQAAAARDLTAVGRSLGNSAQGWPRCSCVPFLDVTG